MSEKLERLVGVRASASLCVFTLLDVALLVGGRAGEGGKGASVWTNRRSRSMAEVGQDGLADLVW